MAGRCARVSGWDADAYEYASDCLGHTYKCPGAADADARAADARAYDARAYDAEPRGADMRRRL